MLMLRLVMMRRTYPSGSCRDWMRGQAIRVRSRASWTRSAAAYGLPVNAWPKRSSSGSRARTDASKASRSSALIGSPQAARAPLLSSHGRPSGLKGCLAVLHAPKDPLSGPPAKSFGWVSATLARVPSVRDFRASTEASVPERARTQAPMIRATGLVKRYGDVIAVRGIDVEVAVGEAFGFLGPNGAGKSSTMRM